MGAADLVLLTNLHEKSRRGITLYEVLFVCLMLFTLALLLVPLVLRLRQEAEMREAVRRGAQIFVAVRLLPLEMRSAQKESFDRQLWFPRSTGLVAFRSSTDYFRAIVTNHYLMIDYSYFAARGIPAYAGSDPEGFAASNNAWCVTADLEEPASRRPRYPLYFTRNLHVTNLAESLSGSMYGTPFGDRGLPVVFSDGSGDVLRRTQLASEFCPQGLSNAVLRP